LNAVPDLIEQDDPGLLGEDLLDRCCT